MSGENWIRCDIWEEHGGGTPTEPLSYSLDLTAFVQLATSAYTEELRKARGLDIAIAMYFAHSAFVEVQLTMAVATLENLVGRFERVRGYIYSAIPRELFDKYMRPGLDEAVSSGVGRLKEKSSKQQWRGQQN